MDYQELEALRKQLYELANKIHNASHKAHEVFCDVDTKLEEVKNEA